MRENKKSKKSGLIQDLISTPKHMHQILSNLALGVIVSSY